MPAAIHAKQRLHALHAAAGPHLQCPGAVPNRSCPPGGIWRHMLFSGAASPERYCPLGHREQPLAPVVASVRSGLAHVPEGLQCGRSERVHITCEAVGFAGGTGCSATSSRSLPMVPSEGHEGFKQAQASQLPPQTCRTNRLQNAYQASHCVAPVLRGLSLRKSAPPMVAVVLMVSPSARAMLPVGHSKQCTPLPPSSWSAMPLVGLYWPVGQGVHSAAPSPE